MEVMNFNWTSVENSFDNSFNISESMNTTHRNHSDNSDFEMVLQIIKRLNRISIGIGLPLTLIVIVAVFLQVKKDQGVPVYVINLLFSDLIQFCGRIINLFWHPIGLGIMFVGLMASIGFMVCISLERYLVIAKPLWYRFRRNIKTYVVVCVVVCVVVWTLPLPILLTRWLTNETTDSTTYFHIIVPSLLLLPFPLFIFFLVGTIKALSGALSVPAEEKRRIVAIQVVVLLIYTLLFLPVIIFYLMTEYSSILDIVALVCVCLSPLADTILYLLTRKSILDKFLASLCSCKASDNQEMSSKDTESTTAPHTETV
ncbi:G-protein coupled receptor 4-like [Fundulus heteroclitus]|uniref:G-protein coupled receptor 4-like n=1 Tax=Fundulus heteroclitus TaxID=8078 RepID=UPI00165A71E1|nr:G-protein coupled receptor 4-like [Fundulus heteroclitus]XP_035982726.1 G-protein coupled receptor 4-like [Fundulus heteroclitus]